MTELTLEVFLSIFIPIVSIIFFFFGLILTYLRSIEKSTDNIGRIVGIAFKEEVVNYYKKMRGNPRSNENDNPGSEKDILLQKLEEGTITRDESRRLRAILEQEAANARIAGAIGALLAILGLLALLALLSSD